jgi:hypothetical protein
MSKIIGGIFTVVGTFLTIFLAFLRANTSNFFDYNDPKKHLTFLETGYAIPAFIAFLLLSIGLTFLFVSKEPNVN